MSRTRTHSLALVVAACTAAVIAGGMALYAVLQYFLTPGHTVLGLVLEHSWHVVVLGVLIYAALYSLLYWKVLKPIRMLSLKLYAIGGGSFKPISVQSGIREVQEVAEGINLMLTRINRAVPEVSLADLAADIAELRSIAKSSGLDQPAREVLLAIGRDFEDAVTELLVSSFRRDDPAAGDVLHRTPVSQSNGDVGRTRTAEVSRGSP